MRTLTLTIFLLLISVPAYADVCIEPGVTRFDDEIAGRMVVELEQCRMQKDSIDLYKQTIENLEEQLKLQEEMLEVYKNSFAKMKEQIGGWQKLVDDQKEYCEAAIKKAKPGLIERIVTGVGFMGLGGAITLILILL